MALERALPWVLTQSGKEQDKGRLIVYDRCDCSIVLKTGYTLLAVSTPSYNLYRSVRPTKLLEHHACYLMYSPIISQRDEAVSVIPPPLGITPDFVNPPSRAHTFVALNIALMSISTLFMGLRFYTASFILRHIRADDCKLSCYSY
jgi:hypothetical protein